MTRHNKAKLKRSKTYQDKNKRVEHIKKEQKKYKGPITKKDREEGLISNHKLSEKYRCTYHAAERFLERVFKQEPTHLTRRNVLRYPYEDIERAAQLIIKSLDVVIRDESEGEYPLFDDYYAIIKSGIVVTIIQTTKEGRACVEADFPKVISKEMKEL